MYMIKCIADALIERIEVTDSYYVLSKLARDLATVCDYILEAEGKKVLTAGTARNLFEER